MLTQEVLISQARQALVESNDTLSPQQLYSRFVNECSQLNVTEKDFYMGILKPAYKSIDWDLVKLENNESARHVGMFCPECGTMNEEKGNYCAECGNKLDL